jgi:cholest-4-en-3-one 26-monooxygenase
MASDNNASDLSSVDLTDVELFADGPPHELFARMRSEDPVRWNPTANGPEFWSLTRAADIVAVSEDPQTFSSHEGGVFLTPDTLAPLDFARNFSIFKDPPEHEKYRDIVRQAFLARTMLALDEVVDNIVSSTLDKIVDKGECDLVADVAVPIPLAVIAKMLGTPDENLDQLLTWTDEIADAIDNNGDATETLQKLSEHLGNQADDDVVRGVDSLATHIAKKDSEDNDHLSQEERAAYFAMLVFAGNQPTRDAISGGIFALLENPDQLELLRNEPSRVRLSRSGLAPVAIHEILRWTSPINYFARTATADTTIAEQEIKAGDRLVMWYASANRDPDVYDDADTFNIDRATKDLPHYAFGGGGPHHCQGELLANKVLATTIKEVLARIADLELAGEVERARSTFVNSLTSLPVRFKSSG